MTPASPKPAVLATALRAAAIAMVCGFGICGSYSATASAAAKFHVGDRWDWQLKGPADLDRDVEMLTLDPRLVTADQLQALRAQGVDTVCHVNAGTIAETDPGFSDLPPAVIGSAHKTRPNERYLDIRRLQMVVPVITQQIVACKNQGFTAIEPDGLDAYAQDSSFPLTAADTVHYATTLAHVAHGLGLRIAQKNVPELTEAMLPHFDFAITESCFATGTCEQIAAYPKANKPAFNAEYTDADIDFAKACTEGARLNINMIRKDRPVTAPVIFCQAEF
jgi:hypothetical protein